MLKSWDFWDTLVTRSVISPVDVFNIVEERSGVVGFSRERVAAEAKSRVGINETNLCRIYDYLPYDANVISRLKTLELETELCLASAIRDNVADFQAQDLVISDMYLDRSTICQIAKKCGVSAVNERCFVSSEYNATKHEGALFDVVCSNFGEITKHIGDNLQGDVRVPESKGIEAVHYIGAIPTQLESQWLKQPGDGKYFSGLLRASRLAINCPKKNKNIEWDINAQIVAPVLVQFVEWIFEDAKKRGITKIYFLSRDGQILNTIAEKLVVARNLNFTCQYLYASRQAFHLPGHWNIEESENWLLESTSILTLRIVAARAGISLTNFTDVAFRYLNVDVDLNLVQSEREILRSIIRDPDFVTLFDLSANNAFELATDYFRQEGLLNSYSEPVAIVDVGWNARLQRSLDNVFLKSKMPINQIHGYYLGLLKKCVYREGLRVHGFVLDPFDQTKQANIWLERFKGMLEFFLGADHPSVHAYIRNDNGRLGPLFLNPVQEQESEEIQFRQTAITAYVDRYCMLTKLLNRPLIDESQSALRILRHFLEKPTAHQALAFIGKQHTEQQVESDFIPMVKKLKFKEVLPSCIAYQHGIWPEGSCALSGILWLYNIRKWLAAKKKQITGILY